MRTAARRDANEGGIVLALRRADCLVQPLFQGDGVPDLLVWCPRRGAKGELVLLEVKDPAQKPYLRRLHGEQKTWHEKWSDAPVFVVETIEDALSICSSP